MKKLLSSILSFLLISITSFAQSTTVNCNPISNNGTGYVNKSIAGYANHYGNINIGESTFGIENRGFAIFDLSGIPDNAVIESVALNIHAIDGFSSNYSSLEFRKLLGDPYTSGYQKYSWSSNKKLFESIGGNKYSDTYNTYDDYYIPLSRCYLGKSAVSDLQRQIDNKYKKFGVGFWTPNYNSDDTKLTGDSYRPRLVVTYSLRTIQIKSTVVKWKNNGIWQTNYVAPGNSVNIYPDHGSKVDITITRTSYASLPAEFYVSDFNNSNSLTKKATRTSVSFYNCVGSQNTQVWAGVNTTEGRVQIKVYWKKAPKADLSVSNISVDNITSAGAVNYQVGQKVKLRSTVWNTGGTQADANRLGYYISDTKNSTSESPFATDYTEELPTGKGSNETVSYTFTASDVGTRYFVFNADYQNVVDEASESNNIISYGPFEVVAPPSVSLTPESYNFGSFELPKSSEEFAFTLTNTGQTTVTGDVDLKYGEHFSITSGDGSFSLSPGESKTIKVKFIPKSIGAKTDLLLIHTDGISGSSNQTELTGTGIKPPETITAYSQNFIFDTRQKFKGGIFLKVIETNSDTTMVCKVGYEYSFTPLPTNNITSGTVTATVYNKKKFELNSDNTVFLTPPSFPTNAIDKDDFLNKLLFFDKNDNLIGHINFDYSFEYEGMHSRQAVIFFHNDSVFGKGSSYFPYSINNPNNPPGKTYNYYDIGEYPVSMLIPPHYTEVTEGYRFPAKYDKKPILFVHGLTGTFSYADEAKYKQTDEQGDQVSYWFDTVRKLNAKNNYDAWQFYYPNEDDLTHISLMLGKAADYLYSKYNTPINFVTHSMGGLVTMEYLTKHYDNNKTGKVLLNSPPIHGSLGANKTYLTKVGKATLITGKDGKAPSYRDISLGSTFMYKLHHRVWPKDLINNTFVAIGLTQRKYSLPLNTVHQEATYHNDGVVSFSSASLIEKGIGFLGFYGNHDDGKYSKTLEDKSFWPNLIDAYFDEEISFEDYCTSDATVEVFVEGDKNVIKPQNTSFENLSIGRLEVNLKKGILTLLLDETEQSNCFYLHKVVNRYDNTDVQSYVISSKIKLISTSLRYKFISVGRFNKNQYTDIGKSSYYYTKSLINTYWGDIGFEFENNTLPLFKHDNSGMPFSIAYIEPKIMQHQFIEGKLKSVYADDADQQTPMKLIKVEESISSVYLFIDDQTSFAEFYLYNDFLFYDNVGYSISLESPDGTVINPDSKNITFSRDAFTGLNKLSLTDPIPGEWKVTAVLDTAITPETPFKTIAKLASEIKAKSLIAQYDHDVRKPVELSALLTVPDAGLLISDSIKSYAIIEDEEGLTDTISLTSIRISSDSVIISNAYQVDTAGVYNYSLILAGVYNDYRFERAVYGDFVTEDLSSAIVIPDQELTISNRSVNLSLPKYFDSRLVNVDSVSFEVGIDSMSFVDGDFYFVFDPETKQLSLNVVEGASLSEAWFWVECYATDSLVASTDFKVTYTTPGIPVNLSVYELTSSSANLYWTPKDVENKWDVLFGPSGFNPSTEGELIENVSEHPYGKQALNTGTCYDFYVRAVLNDTVKSAWSWPETFTTDHIITANATSYGSIEPMGAVDVEDGTDKLFTITPDNHYHVSDVIVDGVSVGAVSSYLFQSVNASLTIDAQFSIDVYSVSGSPNNTDYGSVTGSGDFEYGQYVTLEATPADGYTFTNWTENGNIVSTDAIIEFQAEADRTLTANFQVATDLSEINIDKVKIYPNPFHNKITISNAMEYKKAVLTNYYGQVIMEAALNSTGETTIDTPELPTGIYLITITDNTGRSIVTKLVKE